MAPDKTFLQDYSGQTTDELLQMSDRYRIDSIVGAFESAIQKKMVSRGISSEERCILAVEALEREVNNGGYHQFFVNSSNEFVPDIVSALGAIGCPTTAQITSDAIALLQIEGELTREACDEAASERYEELSEPLGECDSRFYAYEDPIADRLFAWIQQNKALVSIP